MAQDILLELWYIQWGEMRRGYSRDCFTVAFVSGLWPHSWFRNLLNYGIGKGDMGKEFEIMLHGKYSTN